MANDEAHQIDEVVRRLANRHPAVAADTVARVVHEAHQRFSDSHIRDFIPLLVERIAAKTLTAAAT
ncbi:three-helix bundle dimerization domain-containing protein [Nocardia sp. NPDC088792]|uniref:three-helix bundle dimerization domain-containing protein n=1 Tax=Nocardia sp. NPDC088792 TaxID=3364332 RepID=UPI0037F73564